MAARVCNRNRVFAAVMAALLFCALSPFTANTAAIKDTAKQQTELFAIAERSNMAVTIYFDKEEPTVYFVSPDGAQVTPDTLTAERGSGAVCFYIPNAMPGQWVMFYNKGSNATLDVNWAPYANSIKITDFGFTPFDGQNNTEVHFTVTSGVDGWYNYTVYAAVADSDGNVSGTKELTKGTANVNQQATARVYTDKLQTYDKYRLYLDVWRSEYGLEASDNALADGTFSVNNPNAAKPIEDINIEVDLTDSLLSLDWGAYKVWCDEYVLAVFDTADESEPIYANSFTSDVTETIIGYSPDSAKLRLELSYIQNGAVSQMLRKDVPIETGVSFGMPTMDVVSAKQVTVDYQADKPITAEVKVNDKSQQVAINGGGSFSVEIGDFDNEIEISFSLSDKLTVYRLRSLISVDTTPPMLYLPENDVTLFVSDLTFDLAGATEIDCVLTINSEVVPLNADGTFIKTLTLADGDNEFIVNSTDPSGNVTTQLVVINKLKPGAAVGGGNEPLWKRYITLIAAFSSSIVLLVLSLVFTRAYTKGKAVSKAYAACALVRNILAAILATGLAFTGYVLWRYLALKSAVESEKLFSEARASISGAYDTIREYELYGRLLKYGVITVGGIIVLFAASVITARALKKRTTTTPSASAETEEPDITAEGDKTAESGKTAVEEPYAPIETKPETVGDATEERAVSPPEKEPTKYVCPNCGAKYDKPIKFCGKCGGTM